MVIGSLFITNILLFRSYLLMSIFFTSSIRFFSKAEKTFCFSCSNCFIVLSISNYRKSSKNILFSRMTSLRFYWKLMLFIITKVFWINNYSLLFWINLSSHMPTSFFDIVIKNGWCKHSCHAGHCWRSRDDLISEVLRWTPSHGRAKAGRPARTYILQLCVDTGCSLEDLPEAMNDRDG